MGYPLYENQINDDIAALARVTETPPELLGARSALGGLPNRLTEISTWIDDHNTTDGTAAEEAEHRLWGRTIKVGEEIAEASAAGLPDAGTALLAVLNGRLVESVIGYTGQNPRKGVTHTGADIDKELFDVALTALAARESRNGNDGTTLTAFAAHVEMLHRRAGLASS